MSIFSDFLTNEPGNKAWSLLLDSLFPPRCAGCEEWSRETFCRFCLPKLRPVNAPFCASCGVPFDPLSLPAPLCRHCRARKPHYEAARAAFIFDGPTREAVHRLKYQHKTALASRFAPLLADTLQGEVTLRAFAPQWIVPIPLHAKRLRKRGFNQSYLLARELGRVVELPVVELLQRNRETASQVDLKRADRIKNLRDAFSIDAEMMNRIGGRGARFLLIDDVLTTGSTLDEAARTLKKGGAQGVCALTFGVRE